MRTSNVGARAGGLFAGLTLAVGAAHGAADLCDRALPSPANDAYAYRQRDDRCEGRYIREVGSTPLLAASFTAVFEPHDAARDADLSVAWPSPPGAREVQVRAQSMRRRLYYRMDTRRPAADGIYLWPTKLLAALAVGSKDYGIVVTAPMRVGAVERNVLLPARVTYGRTAVRAQQYELILVPGVQLEELSVALAELDPGGEVRRVARAAAPLQYGYYPAERAISIALPLESFGAPGIYRVDLVARLVGGGANHTQAWLFHPGP